MTYSVPLCIHTRILPYIHAVLIHNSHTFIHSIGWHHGNMGVPEMVIPYFYFPLGLRRHPYLFPSYQSLTEDLAHISTGWFRRQGLRWCSRSIGAPHNVAPCSNRSSIPLSNIWGFLTIVEGARASHHTIMVWMNTTGRPHNICQTVYLQFLRPVADTGSVQLT